MAGGRGGDVQEVFAKRLDSMRSVTLKNESQGKNIPCGKDRYNAQGVLRETRGEINRIQGFEGNGTWPRASQTLVAGGDPMLWKRGSRGRFLSSG